MAVAIVDSNLLFVGTFGKVAAIHKPTATEVWRNELPGAGNGFVTLLAQFGMLYVGTSGHLRCLIPLTGQMVWANEMKGLAYDFCCLATNAARKHATDLAYGVEPSPQGLIRQFLYVGTHGSVVAVDGRSGQEQWRVSLPHTGYNIVTLLFEDHVLFVGSHGKLFGLDPYSGRILFCNELPGMKYASICLATTSVSMNAGHDPVPQVALKEAQEQAQTSA